jgi:hypothetical protein
VSFLKPIVSKDRGEPDSNFIKTGAAEEICHPPKAQCNCVNSEFNIGKKGPPSPTGDIKLDASPRGSTKISNPANNFARLLSRRSTTEGCGSVRKLTKFESRSISIIHPIGLTLPPLTLLAHMSFSRPIFTLSLYNPPRPPTYKSSIPEAPSDHVRGAVEC